MALAKLQRHLERLYDVTAGHDVEDFLIHDVELATRLDTSPTARRIPEKLLLRETTEGVDVALYLEAAMVERLRRDDPTERLHAGNLADFLTALEGVSHFLYLVWSANHERRVSLLELELQAEIDKFVLAAMLLARRAGGTVPSDLHHWLFDESRLDPGLEAGLRDRYRDANAYARRYCGWLQRRFMSRRRLGMMSELRRFYRLGHHEKLSRIRHGLPH
jgi:hypothetical protein